VDVRLGEPREDAAAAEVDDLGRGQRRLVRADPARNPVAGDRERTRGRERGIEGANDPVLENHSE